MHDHVNQSNNDIVFTVRFDTMSIEKTFNLSELQNSPQQYLVEADFEYNTKHGFKTARVKGVNIWHLLTPFIDFLSNTTKMSFICSDGFPVGPQQVMDLANQEFMYTLAWEFNDKPVQQIPDNNTQLRVYRNLADKEELGAVLPSIIGIEIGLSSSKPSSKYHNGCSSGDYPLTNAEHKAKRLHAKSSSYLRRESSDKCDHPEQILLAWAEDPQTTQTITWSSGTEHPLNKIQYQKINYTSPQNNYQINFEHSSKNLIEVAQAQEITGNSTEYEGQLFLKTTLRNLIPDSSYAYRVGAGQVWSEPAVFTTAGKTDNFSFLYLGDIQDGYPCWGAMLNRIKETESGIRFGILGGDLVGEEGSREEWRQFFAAAVQLFKHIPLLPVVGNHDDTEFFWQYFALPLNGPDNCGQGFYSFDYGNCHFAILNSNLLSAPGIGSYEKIVTWLKNDFAASKGMWNIIALHYPPYPVWLDWRAEHLQNHWAPIFEQCQADLILVGHQHVYMRTKPLRDGKVQAEGQGIVYIMGNAGTRHYSPGHDYEYIAIKKAYVSNYQVITVNGSMLTIIAKDAQGHEIDRYTMQK